MAASYKIGFTRHALLTETQLIAQLYNQMLDWEAVKSVVEKDNILQTRTKRSSQIIFSEIYKRLTLLNNGQIELIANDDVQDARQLVWISICRQYRFIGDFAIEVLIPASLSGRQQIDYVDYNYFFNSKAEVYQELEDVSDKTRSNARQMVFQIMRQCELITDGNQLIPQFVSSALQNCTPENEMDFIPGAIRL